MEFSLFALKALADETRLRLIYILYHFELNVNELVTVVGMGQSRISRHLKILSAAGLLYSRRDGLWVFYSVPEKGRGQELIKVIMPFIEKNSILTSDIEMAEAMIEERANKTRLFFNNIAEDWDKLATDVLGEFNLPKAIVDLMPFCETACDLGCGTGAVLENMCSKAQTVIGVDGSARMLELARRRFTDEKNISLRIGDLSHLPLRDAEADVVSLNLVLHHMTLPLEGLQEAYRVIKKNGLLIVTDFDVHNDETMRSTYGDRWLGFTEEMLLSFLKKAGFFIRTSKKVPIQKNLYLHIIQAERSALL